MKLKLTQPGFETFTGQLGLTTFTNGQSDNELSVEECAGIAAICRCDEVVGSVDVGADDITDPNIVQQDATGSFNVDTFQAPVDPNADKSVL